MKTQAGRRQYTSGALQMDSKSFSDTWLVHLGQAGQLRRRRINICCTVAIFQMLAAGGIR